MARTLILAKITNPISDLISLPIQSNYDFNVGPGEGHLENQYPTGDSLGISEDWK